MCRIASFLQNASPYAGLHRYEDWWEHDGLHFYRGPIDFNVLYGMINSPRNLLQSTPADDFVHVGVAPEDNSWYLRYRAEWDDEGFNLIGSCALVLPQMLAEKFRNELPANFGVEAKEQSSETYYREVIG